MVEKYFDKAGVLTNIKAYKLNFVYFATVKTGDWKNHFGPELNQRIDAWMDQNLSGTDLTEPPDQINRIYSFTKCF